MQQSTKQNQKKGRQKEGNLPPRKLSPEKCLQKNQEATESPVPPREQEATESPSASKRTRSNRIPKCLQKNRKQQSSQVPPKEQEATESVVGRLDMYHTKVLLYRTMVLLARPTKVRRQTCDRVKIHRFTISSDRFTESIFCSDHKNLDSIRYEA